MDLNHPRGFSSPTSSAVSGTRPETRLAAGRGLLTGLVGGACCIAGAAAVGLGLGGATFFVDLMGQYQGYFMLASLGLMAFWIARIVRGAGLRVGGIQLTMGLVARRVAVMGLTYVTSLAIALAAGRLAGLS